MNFKEEIESLEGLANCLKQTKDLEEKKEILLQNERVAKTLSQGAFNSYLPNEYHLCSKIALYSLIAINQHEVVFSLHEPLISPPPKEKIRALLAQLVDVDKFYESIGGIVGYQAKVLKLLSHHLSERASEEPKANLGFTRVEGLNLCFLSSEVKAAILEGIKVLSDLGEIYPIGGLGSRLNFKSKSRQPLPAACLPFCGRSLLEGLVRDVQAREYLYYKIFHSQITVPIAIMTASEKHYAARIHAICEQRKWFGRPKESFRLFSQLSVPVVTIEGKWSTTAPFQLNLQPGGHGALWKSADDSGVFLWFQSQEKKHLLIRQINNPIAGLDFSLLAFVGRGKIENKTFGFASCERLPHAAEGILVLAEKEGKKRITNIEYTDFKRNRIDDGPAKGGYSPYPANTNIIYANLDRILPILKKSPLPGLMLNMKNRVPFFNSSGIRLEKLGGRLESMMQNLSDAIESSAEEPLATFLTYNSRKKTISTAKRVLQPQNGLLETPEGAFYDLLSNAYDLLKEWCGGDLPPFSNPNSYLNSGPSLLFLYHPALGPLYSLIGEKIRKIVCGMNSELQLEIADVLLDHLCLDGSLLISAQNVMGHLSQGIIRYSHQTGKCFLKNIRVINKGINRNQTKYYWQNKISRDEALKIHLEGHSEFYAENITFEGNHSIVIPDGERWIASQSSSGTIRYHVEKPSWNCHYREINGNFSVEFSGLLKNRG